MCSSLYLVVIMGCSVHKIFCNDKKKWKHIKYIKKCRLQLAYPFVDGLEHIRDKMSIIHDSQQQQE